MKPSRDLAGLRIVVTRPAGRGEDLAAALRSAGALPILAPAVRIEEIDDIPGLDPAIEQLHRYDWVVFTSAQGVEVFWERLGRLRDGGEPMRGIPVAAIGPATAQALRIRQVQPEFVPEAYVGEALAQGLPMKHGQRILLPRAAGSRPTLPQLLRARGAEVDEFHLYRAVQILLDPQTIAALKSGVDALTFTSPSTVQGFIQALHQARLDPLNLSGAPIVACIGPITAEAAAAAGLKPEVVAERYALTGLIEALLRFYRKQVAL